MKCFSLHFLSFWLWHGVVALSTTHLCSFISVHQKKTPPQKEAETASIDSVMAEDHAVLLKSVKKSRSKAAPVEITILQSDPGDAGVRQ